MKSLPRRSQRRPTFLPSCGRHCLRNRHHAFLALTLHAGSARTGDEDRPLDTRFLGHGYEHFIPLLQVLRYENGQFYMPHYDLFSEEMMRKEPGGNRCVHQYLQDFGHMAFACFGALPLDYQCRESQGASQLQGPLLVDFCLVQLEGIAKRGTISTSPHFL